jgi:hypothetical protein
MKNPDVKTTGDGGFFFKQKLFLRGGINGRPYFFRL